MHSFTSNSKAFVWTFVGFLALSVVGFVASSEAIIRVKVVPVHNDYKYRELFLSSQSPNAIFGDSHAAYSLIGLEDFVNLAYPGNSFMSISGRVRLYFENRKPQKVILQAGSHHFSRDFLNWRPDDIENFRILLEGRSPYPLKLLESAHRHEVFDYWAIFLQGERFAPNKQIMPDGAFLESGRFSSIPSEERRARTARTLRILEPVPGFEATSVAREYADIIGFLKDRGAQVCLVTFPVVGMLRVGVAESAAYQRAMRFFEDLGRAKGVRHLNLSAWELPDEYFADPHHLNAIGGRAVSGDVLKECFG